MDPDTVDDVARRLSDVAGPVFRRSLGDLYACSAELRHEPPLESSTASSMAAVWLPVPKLKLQRSRREIADQRYAGAEVSVDGHVVAVKMSLTGWLADGRLVSLPTRMRCAVDNGQVVAITHEMGPEVPWTGREVAEWPVD